VTCNVSVVPLQLLAEQLRGLSAGSPEATIGASAKFSTAVRVCHTCLRVCEPLIEYGSDEVVSSAAFKPFWVKVRNSLVSFYPWLARPWRMRLYVQVVEHMQITDRVRDALQTLLHSPVAAETEAVIGYCDVSLQLLSRCVKHAVTAHGVAFQWAVTPYCEYYYSLLTDKFWRRTPPTPAPAEDGSVDDDDEDTSGECEEFVVCTFATVASVLSEESFFNGSQPAAASIAAFWSSERLNGLLIAAVSHGLLLTPRERKDWAEDPEDYAVHQVRIPSPARGLTLFSKLAVVDCTQRYPGRILRVRSWCCRKMKLSAPLLKTSSLPLLTTTRLWVSRGYCRCYPVRSR
jgi:hypothetical protein